MNRRRETIEASWFDALYRDDPDPWRFRTSDYERAKYQATLDALSRAHYGQALEIGCAIGTLTRRLAERCDAVLAIDGSERALSEARQECSAAANVAFACRMVPDGFPDGRYDLILLSEVLYYLDAADLTRLAGQCFDALRPDGEIVLCHWLGETDYPLSGREASDLFAAATVTRAPAPQRLAESAYRLERYRLP